MTPVESARNKVRTIQIALLMTGGVLILFGITRFNTRKDLLDGYKALWASNPAAAVELFEKQTAAHPLDIEARIGRTLGLLYLGRVSDAEREWEWLTSPSEDALKEHEKETSRVREKYGAKYRDNPELMPFPSFPLSRLEEWKSKNPRAGLSRKGEILMSQAWLAADKLLQGYRRGDPQDVIDRLDSMYREHMDSFRNWVSPAPSDPGNPGSRAQDRPAGDEWVLRFRHVEALVVQASKRSDIDTALSHMVSGTKNMREEPDKVLSLMFDPYLERAVNESPLNPEAHSWRLLVLAEYQRRVLAAPGGKPTSEQLRAALIAADKLHAMSNKPSGSAILSGARPEVQARFHFAMALGFKALAADAHDRPDLLAACNTSREQARTWLGRVPDSSAERASLLALQSQVGD